MVKRIGTTQRKTRYKFKLSLREKGKLSLSKYFQVFNSGETVGLKISPRVTKGRFHSRFHGLSGVVKGKKGECYEVQIKDGDKQKTVCVHPIHLKRL
ncbi:MAG TPA: 50S ribosomal protein L21e [Candidatus Nanoarchaeia archaeon]|nr:50S ribosomal protein L21e [Candidatus Nanoarchaeia archaeon]